VQAAEGDFSGMMLTGVIGWALVCCLARKGLQVAKREKLQWAKCIKRKVCGLTVAILVTFCLSMSLQSNLDRDFHHAMDLGLKLDSEMNTPA